MKIDQQGPAIHKPIISDWEIPLHTSVYKRTQAKHRVYTLNMYKTVRFLLQKHQGTTLNEIEKYTDQVRAVVHENIECQKYIESLIDCLYVIINTFHTLTVLKTFGVKQICKEYIYEHNKFLLDEDIQKLRKEMENLETEKEKLPIFNKIEATIKYKENTTQSREIEDLSRTFAYKKIYNA
jgi:hypothetical protein